MDRTRDNVYRQDPCQQVDDKKWTSPVDDRPDGPSVRGKNQGHRPKRRSRGKGERIENPKPTRGWGPESPRRARVELG